MIRRLRSAHRIVWLVALLVLPAVVVLGLGARRPPPLVAPEGMPPALPLGPSFTWVTQAGSVVASLVRLAGDSTLALELSGATALRGPDLLLYWSPRPRPIDTLDSLDILLGSVSGQPRRRFPLPAAAGIQPGSIVLFSLAHHAVLGARALDPGAAGTR